MKKFVALLLAVMMMVVSFASASAMTAGTYTGTAKGFGGDVTVTVEVSDSAIVAVTAEGANETPGIGTTALERLPGAIVESQTLKLDAIAGCTVTSKAVLAAAETALRAAGAADDVIFAEPTAAAVAAEAETIETNVLIVGGGAAGLAAALRADQNGVEDVIVIEKMPAVGGATATAGGGMQAYVVSDDPEVTEKNIEELFLYWCRTGKFTNNARLTMMAARLSTPTVRWLNESGVPAPGETDAAVTAAGAAVEAATFSPFCEGGAAGAIKNLSARLEEAGVPVMLDTKAEHLIYEDGKVTGVIATGAKGQQITFKANAVLLATGGYGNNLDFVTNEDVLNSTIYYGPVCSTGDGHVMVKELGIPLFNMDKVATKHFGVETAPGKGIHIHGAVAKLFKSTGAIAVNKAGERVVNESGDELDIALASMYKSENGRLYIVCDQASYDVFRAALAASKYFSEEQQDQFIAENGSGITKLVKNDTLAGTAEILGIDVAGLEASVAAYNENVKAGGADPFKRPFTAELSSEGPYYVLETVARFATTLGGVNVSDNLEVLDVNEQPVPGLYAAGEVVGNVNGSYAHYLIWCFGSGMHFGDVIANK